MKLYYAPGTCALACWIALEWSGQEFEVERVDPHSPDYAKINPLAMVPALDIGGPRAMTQAGAILGYIADISPDAQLGSDGDPVSSFNLEEIMSFLSSDLHPAFWPWFSPARYTTSKEPAVHSAIKAAAEIRVGRAMTYLDNLIDEQGYVYHGRRSIADALAYVMVQWTRRMERPWNDYAGITRMVERMNTDPAVQNVQKLSA